MIQCCRVSSLTAVGAVIAVLASGAPAAAPREPAGADFILRNGTIYDGSGRAPYRGDVAIKGDRIAFVGPHAEMYAATDIDVKGQAVAPGFINMLAHPEESLLRRWSRLERSVAGRDSRSDGRRLDGAAEYEDGRS